MDADEAKQVKKALRTRVHPIIFGDKCTVALNLYGVIEARLAQIEELKTRVEGIDDAYLEEHQKKRKEHLLDFIARYRAYYKRFQEQWTMLDLQGVSVQKLSEWYDAVNTGLDRIIAGNPLTGIEKANAESARDELKGVVKSVQDHADIIPKLAAAVKAADQKFAGEKGILAEVQKFEREIRMPRTDEELSVLQRTVDLYHTFTQFWTLLNSFSDARDFRRNQAKVGEYVGLVNGSLVALGRDLQTITSPRFDPLKQDVELAAIFWRNSVFGVQLPKGQNEYDFYLTVYRNACGAMYPNLRSAAEKAFRMVGKEPQL